MIVGESGEGDLPVAANLMAVYAKNCEFPVTVRTAGENSVDYTAERLTLEIDHLRI